eukprot:Plantae.Rhodophyta-Hildenbrandia_rubra.ctg7508.p1 GENE.Plantae.Rhodophyta-Hildenbrandia_rubra.ctg7508~~Plantae.Rhodophyta-Hildenbrandia_rubra.ctg7508.p1  ORF type:complete len:729 (-),score=122.42 Plantae.Rhodophyta-Hildenbrandia_rubra.ctg7508:2874-5003(-)
MPNVRSPAAAKRRRMRQRAGRNKKNKESRRSEKIGKLYNDEGDDRQWEKPPDESTGLDAGLVSYLTQISESLTNLENGEEGEEEHAKDSPEEGDTSARGLLVKNSLMELVPRIHEVARDPLGSRILEKLIEADSNGDAVRRLCETLFLSGKGRVLDVAQHRCGSHVLEKLIETVGKEGAVEAKGPSPGMLLLADFAESLTGDDIVFLISDARGSHVFRVLVAVLAALPIDEPRQAKLEDYNGARPTPYFLSDAYSTTDRAKSSLVALNYSLVNGNTDFGSLSGDPYTSAALQGLLSACMVAEESGVEASKLAVAALGGAELTYLSDMCFHTSGSPLVERIILCIAFGSCEEAKNMLKKLASEFDGHMVEMAEDARANFVLQRWLLFGVKDRGGVSRAWNSLEQKISSLIGCTSPREGVVLALARCAEVYGDDNLRRKVSRAIVKAVSGREHMGPKDIIVNTMAASEKRAINILESVRKWGDQSYMLPPSEQVSAKASSRPPRSNAYIKPCNTMQRFSHVGVLLARCLIRYKGNAGQPIRESMCSLSECMILALSLDSVAARAIEQQIATGYSPKLATSVLKITLSRNDNAILLGMARSPSGSIVLQRSVEAATTVDEREIVIKKLSQLREQLGEESAAKILLRKLRVEEYMERPKMWRERELGKRTIRGLFNEIFEGDDSHSVPKKRKGVAEATKSKRRKLKGNSVQKM